MLPIDNVAYIIMKAYASWTFFCVKSVRNKGKLPELNYGTCSVKTLHLFENFVGSEFNTSPSNLNIIHKLTQN